MAGQWLIGETGVAMHSYFAEPLRLLRTGILLAGAGFLFSTATQSHAQEPAHSPRHPAVPLSADAKTKLAPKEAPKLQLPPLPAGVEELNFAEFFKTPVGDYGLEVTEKLRSLDGKRVRILGFMVHEDLSRCNSCVSPKTRNGKPVPAWMEATIPGRMMFTASPSSVSHAHYGLADDLPPQTVFVYVPEKVGQLVPYTPGPMLLTGVLSVGNKREPEGRISIVRLELDPQESAAAEPAPKLEAKR